MDEIRKHWGLLDGLLHGAAAQISSSPGYPEVAEYLSHNEFELALRALERIGATASVNKDYWRNLRKAADAMEISTYYPALLTGRTIHRVLVFRADDVDAAWVNELTLPIVAFSAFLELSDGEFVRISPCEVELPERYPALGLELKTCTPAALRYLRTDGQAVDAIPLEEAISGSPSTITGIEASDPLGHDAVSQYSIVTDTGLRLVFRHMMPPMTLGVRVDSNHVATASPAIDGIP